MTVNICVKERHRSTHVPTAASSPNAVNILINAAWEVEVDHMLNIRNIQTAGCHRGCNQDWTFAVFKVC